MTSNHEHSSVWSRLTLPELAWALDARSGTVARWFRTGRVTPSSPPGAPSRRFDLDRVLNELTKTSEAHTGRGANG
jgi:hypothetical protein